MSEEGVGTGIECQWVGLSAPTQNGPGPIQLPTQWVPGHSWG